jgi:photosystem II stability/assembly factor-like uncharacterized protein
MKKYFILTLLILIIGFVIINSGIIKPNDKIQKAENNRVTLAPGEYMAHQRMYPYNEIKQENYLQAMEQTHSFRNASAIFDYTWEFAGPTNIGGRITDIESHPDSPETIYLGAATGGVWKSTNNGSSWEFKFDGVDLISIGDIAIDPNNEDVIYAGTGEANSSSFSFIGNGIYKSTDAGESWEHSGLELSSYIGRVIVDYDNSSRIYAAVCGNLFTPSEERGIYRSVDAGETWNRMLFVNDTVAGIDLVQHPDNPDILYAAMWERSRGLEYRHSFGEGSGIWKSTDGGDTWNEMTTGLPTGNVGRPGLAIAKSNPDVLYVFYDMPLFQVGVYKTQDGGDTWTQTNDGELYGMNSSFGWYFGQVRVHPQDENMVWVMGVPVYRSSNGGDSWQENTGWSVHVDNHAMYFDEINNRILLGNDGGLYSSQNNGGSWNKINNLPFTQFYAIDIDYQNPERLVGGTQDNNTIMTNTGGVDDWSPILGGDGMYCLIDYSDPNIVYAEYQWGNLFKSTDGGNNMDYIASAWNVDPDPDRVNWSAPLAMDPVDPNVLYFGTYRVFKSINGGLSWSDVSGDITKGIDQYFHTITTIAVSPVNNDIVIAGTGDGLIHISTNAGASWENITNGIPDRWVTHVIADPIDENTIYATISGFRWDEQLPHVYKSTDLGQTWQNISGDLPELPVNDIVLDPAISDNIYIGTDAGVFFTDNGGEEWFMLSDGLPNVAVTAMKIHHPSRSLVIGTYGVSMYRLNLDDIVSVDNGVNSQSDIIKVFPNPFSTNLSIKGEIQKGMVINVYNTAGMLVLNTKDISDSRFTTLDNGVYFFNFIDRNGKTFQTEKIIKQ